MKGSAVTVGERLGPWTIEDLVSLGIPRTYRVRHESRGTPALLKVMPATPQTTAGQAREVDALRHLAVPGVCTVLDAGQDPDRRLRTTFAWFDGESLLDRLQGGALDWREVCRIVRPVAETLSRVHGAGLVHRDLCPRHVLVGPDGETRLVGFDFAMTQAQLDQLVQAPFGDLGYLAPEVLRDPVHHGARADTYALGCVGYELLTGRAPFPAAAWGARADGATRMLDWKTRSAPLDPGPDCPGWLRGLVTKATHPDPERRLPDLDALVGWLDAARPSWQPGPEVVAAPPSAPTEHRPIPTALVLVPSPSLRPPPLRSVVAAPPALPPPANRAVPLVAKYAAAATLGCLGALGFSSILILFVELRDGVL